MKVADLIVPQGLGDIFWIVQKYLPHYDQINLNIAMGAESPIAERSMGWLDLLPKVGPVGRCFVNRKEMQALLTYEGPMVDEGFYACNSLLEQGVRLEDIDPDKEVEWGVQLEMTPVDLPSRFVCLYVSGATERHGLVGQWDIFEWLQFMELFREKCDLPVVVIGAEFDAAVVNQLASMLGGTSFVGRTPREVTYILDAAEFFIGYQSGLGIIADNLDTPQLMMYFEKYKKLQYAWCRPGHEGTTFQANTFDQSPSDVIRKLEVPCGVK